MRESFFFRVRSVGGLAPAAAVFFLLSSAFLVARPSPPPPKSPALPEAGKTVYFKRHYSAEHLAENPGQLVETLVIELKHLGGNEGISLYLRLQLKGQKRPVYSASGLLLGSSGDTTALRFRLHGEAGGGELDFREDHLLLKLTGQDFLTLTTVDANYGQGFDDEKMITFRSDDPAHRTFKLMTAADDECEF